MTEVIDIQVIEIDPSKRYILSIDHPLPLARIADIQERIDQWVQTAHQPILFLDIGVELRILE